MSLAQWCRIVNISPQAVYQYRGRLHKRAQGLSIIKQWAQDYRMFMSRIDGRKLYWLIKPKLIAHKINLGRDGFFYYLRQHKLIVKPRRSYNKTNFSKHWMKKHPNLTKDAPVPVKPEQILVADITYVTTKQGTHYLSLVTDAYSRQNMGCHLSDSIPVTEVVKALNMAVQRRQYTHNATHHFILTEVYNIVL